MLVTTNGIVIRERPAGDNGKYIDVLTEDLGIIEVLARGVKKINAKNSAATQLFSYSKLCIDNKNGRYFLNSSEIIRIFYNITLDINKYYLSLYFAEILKFAVNKDEAQGEITRLFLNVMHYLNNDERSPKLLKSIFELRFLTEIGLMPNLVACCECTQYSCPLMYFDIDNGVITCGDCVGEHCGTNRVIINDTILHTLRYIVYSDFEKLFMFKLNEKAEERLNKLTEKFLLSQLSLNSKMLDFLNTL